MKDLHDIFEEKKIENEFENREPTNTSESDVIKTLIAERQKLKNQARSYLFQTEQLEKRLYSLQKNFYDDMKIIENHQGHNSEAFPWRSDIAYTRNQYKFWDIAINTKHIGLDIQEVSIRRAGHEKEIKVLDNICDRIKVLDEMYFKVTARASKIKKKLNNEYGQFIVNN